MLEGGERSSDPQLPVLISRWSALYERFGSAPFAHPAQVMVAAECHPPDDFRIVALPADDPSILSAFEKRPSGSWTCVVEADPLVHDAAADAREVELYLQHARSTLRADCVHFPLVYADSASARLLREVPGVRQWKRLPSPIIDWRDRGQDLWSRVSARFGSQARRKRRTFEKRLGLRTLRGEAAARAIDEVEQRSWKAAAGISVHARRGQFDFYSRLLTLGAAEVAAAMDGDRPVAYRLDALKDATVFVLKWSYDDSYAKYSPGFYLLTVGLVERWDEEDVRVIDLFGSPDTLKALVETGRKERVDLAWPDSAAAEELEGLIRTYDRERTTYFDSGKGLRHFFGRSRLD